MTVADWGPQLHLLEAALCYQVYVHENTPAGRQDKLWEICCTQVIPQLFFPDDTSVFQDDNARIHLAQTEKEWFREHETLYHKWTGHHWVMENIWDVLEKTLQSSLTLSYQQLKILARNKCNFGQKNNVMTLKKFKQYNGKCVPQWKMNVIKQNVRGLWLSIFMPDCVCALVNSIWTLGKLWFITSMSNKR